MDMQKDPQETADLTSRTDTERISPGATTGDVNGP